MTTGTRLRTRRADLHGRTPNQTLYLKHIQEHDITFGIGPAAPARPTSPSLAPSTRSSATP
jgi:phosphate starvation-inducible PhoH-like protein